MKLERVSIKNFRSIKHLEFTFPKSGILALVGSNNAGKSNIIRAVDAVCGDQWFGRDKLEAHDHYQRNLGRGIKIQLNFDNRRRAIFDSEADYGKWPWLEDDHGHRIRESSPKEAFPCIYLGADRTFDKHMSFYDWTLVGKIRRAFNRRAKPVEGELRRKFEDIVEVFNKVEGFTTFKEDFSRFFSEMQADTGRQLGIDFKPYTPSNYFKTMHVIARDEQEESDGFDLEELGEGSRNMVLLALLRSYAKNFRGATETTGGMIALEEPELYMHPQARRHLAKVLREIADAGIQVIISTHSASFVDTEFFESIGRVVKVDDEEDEGSQCTALYTVSKKELVRVCSTTGVPAGKSTEENIGEFYKTTTNPALNEAFFARFVILVEGDTEELALPVYLEHEGFDCDLLGISIISVRGKSQFPKYWRLFGAFNIPMLIVADSDTDKAKDKSNELLAKCLNIPTSELSAVSLCKVLRSGSSPQTPVLMLEANFEVALAKELAGRLPEGQSALERWDREARDLIKPHGDQSKGQIARYIARQLCKTYPRATPGFVHVIAELLRQHGFRGSGSGSPEDDPINEYEAWLLERDEGPEEDPF